MSKRPPDHWLPESFHEKNRSNKNAEFFRDSGKYQKTLVPDEDLWVEVSRTITPLRPERADKARKLAETKSREKAPDTSRKSAPSFSPRRTATATVKPAPPPFIQKPVEPALRRKLRRGHIGIDASIDLHGLSQDQAHAALRRFVLARHARGDRTLLVITGKGLKKTGAHRIEKKGVLRSMLPFWLAERDIAALIAGFETSAQAHGGEGAYYVRLKRIR